MASKIQNLLAPKTLPSAAELSQLHTCSAGRKAMAALNLLSQEPCILGNLCPFVYGRAVQAGYPKPIFAGTVTVFFSSSTTRTQLFDSLVLRGHKIHTRQTFQVAEFNSLPLNKDEQNFSLR